MRTKTKVEEQENNSEEIDWRSLLLNEAEWRIQLLAMLERIAKALERSLEENEED